MTATDTKAIRYVRKYKLVHCYDYQSQMLVRPDGSWVKHDDYLALCDETERLRAENERLRAELAWYGEQSRLARIIHSEGASGRHALQADGGHRARDAIRARSDKGVA